MIFNKDKSIAFLSEFETPDELEKWLEFHGVRRVPNWNNILDIWNRRAKHLHDKRYLGHEIDYKFIVCGHDHKFVKIYKRSYKRDEL